MKLTITRKVMAGGAAAALVATAALAGQAAPQPKPLPPQPAQPSVAAPLPHVQALYDGYVRDDKMPGIVGAFGFGDQTAFVSAGHVSDDPGAAAAGPDSLWRVYSMTKPITGMAAMILVEEGKIKLDEPVSDFIPAFKNMKVLTDPANSLASRPAKREITIRNLLTHTAGLGYTIITKGPLLKEYERLGINPASVSAALEPAMRKSRPDSLEEFANRAATLPLIADPGTKWSYSIALDVMGRVIEVASAMPFEQFLKTRIFTPLKMDSTWFQVPRSAVGRLSTNYAFVGDKRVPLDPARNSVFLEKPSFPYGGAGLVSSAHDYDRFLHMLQNGGTLDGVRVMKPETAALGMSNLLPAGVFFPGFDPAHPEHQGFGAGGSVTIAATPGGPGVGTYGWGGAAGTIAFVDPAKHLRGAVMVNYFPADKWPLRTDTVKALALDLIR